MRNAFFLTAGLCSAALLASHGAEARKYTANNPDIPMMGSQQSIVAAMVMGAYGMHKWTPNIPGWESILLNECESKSQASRSGTTGVRWYDSLTQTLSDGSVYAYKECNPSGIADVMNMAGTVSGLILPNQGWQSRSTFSAGKGDLAFDFMVNKMITHGTPLVIPLFGSWDHWATVTAIDAEPAPAGSGYSYDPNNVWIQDAVASKDLEDKLSVFKVVADFSNFFGMYVKALRFPKHVCANTASCDRAPYNDPWYRNYVILWDPPKGGSLTSSPGSFLPIRTTHRSTPLVSGQPMTAALAQSQVFTALRNERLHADKEIARIMESSNAGAAVRIHAYYPSGAPWDIYMVPLQDQEGRAVAMVSLSAQDGSFQQMAIPDHPLPYSPVSEDQAREAAMPLLHVGESIKDGDLTWSPDVHINTVHSPYLPYFEFSIVDRAGREREVARVARNGGQVLGREVRSRHSVKE